MTSSSTVYGQTSFLVPGLKITVIDENIPETGDESIDEMLEVDDNVIEQVTEENTSAETDDIGTSADILQEDSAEADESAESQENDAATQSQETVSQPVQPKYPHARVEEFCHTGGVKDFVDFLSKGEAVSDICASPARTRMLKKRRRSETMVNCMRRR